MDMIGRIRRLHVRDKLSEREIARMTGLSRNTVSKWLRAPVAEAPKYRREARPNKLSAFEATLKQALTAVNACFSVASNALSLFGRASRRYFGASATGARSHFDTVLRDSPVMRAISRSDSLSLTCSRRILPIMSMVITPRTPLLK